MKKITCANLFGLTFSTFLLISSINCSPSQIHNLIRLRRAAASVTPAPSSHESHEINCDKVDKTALKKSCPSNSSCPMDDETVEKCCHCLSLCCAQEAPGSSEEGGMSKNGTMSDNSSAEAEPGNDKGKNLGGKVKDAVSSAEGWLKNTGQNIKSSLDKAADNVKQSASDMKDKVRQGINNIAGKVKNATESSSDCNKGKGALTTTPQHAPNIDGKCTSDNGEDATPESSSSTEAATESSKDATPMTPVPGHKKSKREADDDSSISYETSYASGIKNDDSRSDDDDSAETSWTKTTTTTNNRDVSQRYKREENQKTSDNQSTTTQQSTGTRNKRASESAEVTTEASANSIKGPVNSRHRRASNDDSPVSTTENSTSGKSKRAAGTESGMSTENPTNATTNTESGRSKRGANSDIQMSTTETSNNGRSRRAAGSRSEMSTEASAATTSNPGKERRKREVDSDSQISTTENSTGRNKRSSMSMFEMSTENPSSITNSPGNGRRRRDTNPSDEMTTTESNNKNGRNRRDANISDEISTTESIQSGRRKRASGSSVEFITENPETGTTINPRSERRRRGSNNTKKETSTESSTAASSSEDSTATTENVDKAEEMTTTRNKPSRSGANVSTSVKVVDSLSRGKMKPTLVSSGKVYFPVPIPGYGETVLINSDSQESNMHHRPVHVYPGGGGVIAAASLSPSQNSKMPTKGSHGASTGPDLTYYPPTTSSVVGIVRSTFTANNEQMHNAMPGGSYDLFQAGSRSHDNGNSKGVSNSGNIEKRGQCHALAAKVACLALLPQVAQCSNDNDCLGVKKCCFYACEPHKHVGVCEHPIFTLI